MKSRLPCASRKCPQGFALTSGNKWRCRSNKEGVCIHYLIIA